MSCGCPMEGGIKLLPKFDLDIKSDDAPRALRITLKSWLHIPWGFLWRVGQTPKLVWKWLERARWGNGCWVCLWWGFLLQAGNYTVWTSLQNQKRELPDYVFSFRRCGPRGGKRKAGLESCQQLNIQMKTDFLLHYIVISVTNWAISLNRK